MIDYRVGDTREIVAAIPDGSVSLVATSPPFLALRSYLPADHAAKHAEIGSEPDPATFIDTLLGLTAEWGRVLAPWGSIAIELGDTYSGGTAEGTDTRSPNSQRFRGWADGNLAPKNGPTWPMPKSLALIPQLYAIALAYGRNPLTGAESPAGRWRVRNVIVWQRPNPAVGALGDKFRPSTSYIVVATRDAKRWFDLTAVRDSTTNTQRLVGGYAMVDGVPSHDAGPRALNPAGAPPLDCWFDEWDGSHDTWTITTQPSRIKAEFVERVPCGPDDGGERTTSPDCPVHGDHAALAPTESDDEHAAVSSHHIGRTGTHPAQSQQPAEPCGESTSSRSGPQAANARSTSSNRTDPAPSTSQPDTPSARTADDTAHTSASPESCESRRGTCESSTCEACPPADAPETAPHTADSSYPESACSCTFHVEKHSIHSHYAMWPAKLAERLVLSMCPAEVCTACGTPRRRVEGRYFDGETWESGGLKSGLFRQPGRVDVAYSAPTLGWTDCGCGAPWAPGTVLDPFAGTFTTGLVAEAHGRNAIGIDIDPRNAELVPLRRQEVRRNLFGLPRVDPAQLTVFDATEVA